MTSSAARTSLTRRIAATCAIVGLATIGFAASAKPANAWWYHHGYCCGWGVGVYVPPIVVAPPPPVYYAPPVAYYGPPPSRVWIPAHWQSGYWIPGHWA
jgi:hypothetical protein